MSTKERIRMARLQARMTQKELADKIGVKFKSLLLRQTKELG